MSTSDLDRSVDVTVGSNGTLGSASIDGRRVEVRPGDTILDGSRRCGVDIPVLCHVDGLIPEGGCRICLVDVEGARRPQSACSTALRSGMEILTDTARLRRLRQDVLALTLSSIPQDRLIETARTGTRLEHLMKQLDLGASWLARRETTPPAAIDTVDASHPYLVFDRSLCIVCRACLNTCEGVQGQFVYGIEGRGAKSRLVFGPGERFSESECVACGACVDVCPSDAITDRDRRRSSKAAGGPIDTEVVSTQSVCGYCGVGCRLDIETADNRVLRIAGVRDAEVNRGHLCVKGRYAHAWHHHQDRLTQPLLREGGELRPVDWTTALEWVARRLTELRARYGPDALGAFTSSRSTNEAAYLLQKLFRTAIGTNNVDCCARVCHSSTAMALQLVTGTGAASASFADIEKARCIVVAGANPTEAHPVVGARIKQAVRSGATLIVVDPRRIELAEHADLHLQVRPGTNGPLFNAIGALLVQNGRVDRTYLEDRVEGFDAFVRFASELSLEDLARTTGVSIELIGAAARMLSEAGPTLFVHGLGLSELTEGVASVMTLSNLGMLTGSIGRPGAGMLPLRGQNNVQGNADMGGMPNQVTGYQSVTDPAVRAHIESVWASALPAAPGLTSTEMLDAAHTGRLRGLWVQGEDLAQSDPNHQHVIEALERLDLLIVQDLFPCETMRYAHLVLPAAGALEQSGTFTNGERRIQRVRAAVAPPGEARADWRVFVDVARALGCGWSYQDPAEVMDEIARTAPRLFGGIRYERLDGDGLQWPCPSDDHPGTSRVHTQGFLRGRGRMVSIDHQPSPEHVSIAFPYLLITGRVLDHYNVGTMTRRTSNQQLAPVDLLEIHPEDAARESLHDGQPVPLASRWGKTTAQTRITERVAPGTLFLSFHHPETQTNRLVGPHVDPQSKCPEYKITAVRFELASSEHRGQEPTATTS